MKVSVIGAGYVGLVTAAGLARHGHNVICIDVDRHRVDTINRGVSPICEAGLDDLLYNLVPDAGHLRASTEYKELLATDLTFICVGTPSNSDGSIDLGYIRDSAKRIGKVLGSKENYHVVAIRSTIIPGTTKDVIIPLLEKYSKRKVGKDISIAYNPEFLQEGKAVQAFFSPDRIIIGELDKRAGDLLVDVYKDIVAPVFRTDITTAEMIKYASNAFLATKISFINEIANICQKLGADVYDVVKGLSFDYRIGDKFLSAGIGFGGSCLPKDLRALVYASANSLDYPTALLKAVLDVNEAQAMKLVEIAEQKLGNLDGRKITVLGLAFKPNTDDVRDAPAIRIIRALLEKGAVVKAYDPEAMENAKNVFPKDVKYCKSAKNAISGSECVLIVTEWDEFKDENLYRNKIVIDGRRALEPRKAKVVCDYQGVCW